MRIQHNIIAMNAYRNYTANTSAMQKNLERLSSGYKINRAGDDAAGLAISEKMRAQITGLQVASKNAKDGISLVQTAEGALTEVHDMLNRMVELATQSANGTYAGDTDRTQLQKELDQLKEEINRIADSANFNGIALLDGSMDTTAINGVEYNYVSDSKMKAIFGSKWDNEDFWKGSNQTDIGWNKATKLETEAGKSSTGGFQISLDGIGNVTVGKNENFEIKIAGGSEAGGVTLRFTNTEAADKTYSAAQLVQKLVEKNKTIELTAKKLDGTDYKAKFDVSIGADGTTLVFTATDSDQDDFKLNAQAAVTWFVNGKEGGVDPASYDPWITSNPGPAPANYTAPVITPTAGVASGARVKGSTAVGKASVASTASLTNVTMASIANHIASIASATITFKGAVGSVSFTLASIGFGSTATAALNAIKAAASDIGHASIANVASWGQVGTAAFKDFIKYLINEKLSNVAKGIGSTATTSTYQVGSVAFGSKGLVIDYTEQKWELADGDIPAKAEIDFSGLTGDKVIGATITIGTKTYEFAETGKGSVASGRERVDIKANSTASEVARALAEVINAKGNSALASNGKTGFGVSAVGDKVTITSKDHNEIPNLASTGGTGGSGPIQTEGTIASTGNTLIGIGVASNITISTNAANALSALLAGSTALTPAQVASLTAELEKIFGVNPGTDVQISVTGPDGNAVTANITKIIASLGTSFTGQKLAEEIAKELNKQLEDDGLEVKWISFDGTQNGAVYDSTANAAEAIPSGFKGIFVQIGEKDGGGSSGSSNGTINLALQNVTDNISGEAAGLANTVVDFGAEGVNAWQDGAKITIGDTTYTVALGKSSKFKNVTNVIDLTDLKAGDTDLAKIAAQRLTEAAKGNGIFTVGHDGQGRTTLQQRTAVKDTTDMSTKEGLASYLGVSIADANSIESARAGDALTLQIGDTADSYNQLRVSISDCHTTSLGLDGIDISTQEGAEAAVDKIKNAINYVSDVRGTLGATQNRLDHTINNLSVMTENITDAESTIRDTDVAEEMMAYTKNNILIQAAQAMLAQANQVPQGVLQLLQ